MIVDRPELPWVCAGAPGAEEEFLVGNREGLECLRDALDRALETGEPALFEGEPEIDYIGVTIARDTRGPLQERRRDRLFGLGCLIIILAAIAFAIYGFIRFFQRFETWAT